MFPIVIINDNASQRILIIKQTDDVVHYMELINVMEKLKVLLLYCKVIPCALYCCVSLSFCVVCTFICTVY